jgi:hypothetical protein
MSPAGGVGINLAIQDGIATANLLAEPLLAGRLCDPDLEAVERRRTFPTRVTQTIQIFAHRGIEHVFDNPGPMQAPWQMKAAQHIPGIHRALGYVVGMGARPEHVRSDAREAPRRARLPRILTVGIGVAAAAAVTGWAAWKVCSRMSAAGTQTS